MDTKATSLIVLAISLIISLISHHANASYKSASREDAELERQLRLLNKPSTATIQTTYGEMYNCVNFYDQPAFDHPLLKNSKFDFQPSSSYSVDSSSSNRKKWISGIWLNGKGCPIGTVPIRQVTRDDLLRAKLAAETVHRNSNNLHPHSIAVNPGVHLAVLRTTEEKKYYGAGMITSVYNFAVTGQQYSSSRIKIQNGPDSIIVGWAINPSLYGNTSTRYFIYTNTKDSHCYNTFCPGFIILSPDLPIDYVVHKTSERGVNIVAQKFFIRKDAANGNWFLHIGLDNATVGTWPQKIFTALSDSANYVEWGGETYSPSNDLPAMGSGFLPARDSKYDCYGRQVTLINENDEIDYNPPDCVTYTSNPKRYQVYNEGNLGGDIQRVIEFGGRAGPNGSTWS